MSDQALVPAADAKVVEFDLSKYELADTAIIDIKNKQGDDLLIGADGTNPVRIEIYSPGSPQGKKAANKAARGAQMRVFRAARGETSPQDVQDAEREHVDKLVGFTKRIHNFPISPADLYSNDRLCYISRQVEEGINKFGNF